MTDTKEEFLSPETFLHEEDGAVTVDWVVLTAAIALLAVPLMVSINNATDTASTTIADRVVDATD